MSKRFLFILMLLVTSYNSFAQEQMNISGNWFFALAKSEHEVKQFEKFYIPGFNNSKFHQIPVPSNWAVLGYEEPIYRGFKNDKASEGFYLHKFTIPKDWNNKRILLHFGGVWSSAEVWLNGFCLGHHDSGYTSFSFDISDKVKTDGSNLLAVRVRQISREYKFDVYDDWTLGGIFRDVTLEAMPSKRWIDNITTQTKFDSQFKDADLLVRVMISDINKSTLPGNYPSPGNAYDLKFTLTDKENHIVAQQKNTIPAHISTGRETNLDMRILSPLQWTAETPNLYNLRIDLIEEGKITQTKVQRVGFRQISTTGGVFRINGQAIKLRGVNRHDEFPTVGRATTREHWLQDLTLMKAANINYIRSSHYTPAKGFIELCDSLGMYVGNEVSLGGAGELMYDPSFMNAVLLRTQETISRDINNPSIIYWSIGNEDALTSSHLTSIKLAKAMDPTRPVLIPWRHEEWLPEEIDILSIHYWKPYEYDSIAGHSSRPIISTEYTHAYGTDGMGGLEPRWRALTKHAAGAGAAIWMWADQGIQTLAKKEKYSDNDLSNGDPYLRLDYAGWDGIVDSYRNPTQDYWETKAVYAPVYPVDKSLRFTPGQDTLLLKIQNDYDFTNLNKGTIQWSIYGDSKELDKGKTTLSAQAHSCAFLPLPINSLKALNPNKTYYVHIAYVDAAEHEVSCQTVELIPETPVVKDSNPIYTIEVKKDTDRQVMVTVGSSQFVFNMQTGELTSASYNNQSLITAMRPIIWHTLDRCENAAFGKKNARTETDFTYAKTSVLNFKMQQTETTVDIDVQIDYFYNKENHLAVINHYTITNDGRLKLHYEMRPHTSVSQLPLVGMSLALSPTLEELHWLGLGPYNAYPNKQSASILGVWGGKMTDEETFGNKSTRWIACSNKTARLCIENNSYMEHRSDDVNTLNVLSHVFSRPEKGRKADYTYPQLLSNTNSPFVGEFTVSFQKKTE